ncbi:O-antigen ligase family protein, partial [Candidatus Woesebacteria bacterium]|nr:O-antigen ligase family protein [Candidatus Woesebacteria bacterium]
MNNRRLRNRQQSFFQKQSTITDVEQSQPYPSSIFQRMIVWLYHLLLITTPLFFAFTTDELFEFNKMMLTYTYVVLICTAWLTRSIFEKRLVWKHTKLDYFIAIFLLSQVLSTIFSIHPYTSWYGYYSRFHGGLASLITYALLYWAFVSNVTRRNLRSLLLSTMMAGGIVGLYAIGEHFGHSFSCLMTSGYTSFGVSCWVQDVQHRVFATFGQPNWLAAYALMLLSVLIGTLLSHWPSQWQRFSLYSVYVLLFLTLLYTRSRSGFLGFIAVTLVILFGVALRWWYRRERPKMMMGLLASLTFGMILLSGTPFSPSISEQLAPKEIPSKTVETTAAEPAVVNRLDIGGTDSGEIRKIVWQGAVAVWKRYPLLGSGVETFAYSYYRDRPVAHNLVSEWDFLYNKAHNEFLNFLATTGIVGLISYLALLGGYLVISLIGFIKLTRENKDDHANVVLSMAAAVIGLSVSNFFGFSTVVVTVLQYLAFAVTLLLITNPSQQPKQKNKTSIQQQALFLLVVVAALFVLSSISNLYRADQAYTSAKALLGKGELQASGTEIATALKLNPDEALFWDELAQLYAQAAVSYTQTKTPGVDVTAIT